MNFQAAGAGWPAGSAVADTCPIKRLDVTVALAASTSLPAASAAARPRPMYADYWGLPRRERREVFLVLAVTAALLAVIWLGGMALLGRR